MEYGDESKEEGLDLGGFLNSYWTRHFNWLAIGDKGKGRGKDASRFSSWADLENAIDRKNEIR